jgi:O-antigen/teichoic acid export membrane protein
MGLSNVIGVQYLIPTGRDKKYTISILIGTIVNLTLTIILLINFGTIGAVIASVAGEFVILIVDLFMVKNDISIKKALLSGWKNIIAGIIMGTTLFLIEGKFESSPLNTIILILIGMAIYFIVALILKDEMIFIGIKLIKSKLHKKGDSKIE